MSKICFIIGHGKSRSGGYDPGACSGGYEEYRMAREIALYAQEYYNENYTEQADIMNAEAELYLTERIAEANAEGYDFVAEIHLNAGKGTGTECYHHAGEEGRKYAEAISRTIAEAFGVRDRGAKIRLNAAGKDYFAIIRETVMPAVLVETLFIDSDDRELLADAAGRRKCGEAIARAVAQVRGTTPKPADRERLWRVQVGAFANRENADRMVERLWNAGFTEAVAYRH